MKLNYRDQSDRGRSLKQIKKDNNKIDHTCAVYAKNDIKLSGLIRPVQLVMKTK